jgi:V/A-type H+-transporting ATPase subunit I
MLRTHKMKSIEFTVLKEDMDKVLEYLGRSMSIHFPPVKNMNDTPAVKSVRQILDRLSAAAAFTGIELKQNDTDAESAGVPAEEDKILTENLLTAAESLKGRLLKVQQEKQGIQETLNETQAFSKLNVPFSEMEQLSYLTLRIGRLDPKGQAELRENLGDRAVILPLSDGNRILAASSRKGRFTLDSQLKKVSFEPISFPKDSHGIPSEFVKTIIDKNELLEEEVRNINNEIEIFRLKNEKELKRIYLSWGTALSIESIKTGFTATEYSYHFSGWIPANIAPQIVKDLLDITSGRIAVNSYSPEEVPSIKDGSEKVPVYMKHGAFVKGFEGVVFSYGAPLYGTIDPTPLVAFFFTLLFGIMFGDIGHGFVLFLAGFLISKGPRQLSKFKSYSVPLISIGISSMFFGFLFGAVFTHEGLLIGITRKITAFAAGQPMDRILTIMPLAESGGSLIKLLYFFGFTIGIGVILISVGLLINIANRFILKKYEQALFSKTGLAGLLMFWYAIFIAVRVILGSQLITLDFVFLLTPVVFIFFGPVIWRFIAMEKPVLEHGLMTFIMEGFVEILETVSGYVSNTVSFLRVGAFALSHTVLSYIVFRFAEELGGSGIAGSLTAFLILIFGNALIIVLEGMIVAIQVVRLQYYEFFNKFFVETGVEFSPFRFNTKKI